MMRDTDADWETWGKNDPYFGVLTSDKYRGSAIANSKADFMATGEANISIVMDRLAFWLGSFPRNRALDFGAGVGRLTIPLARRFGEVVGVEVSPSMRAEAEANAAGLSNVSFVPSDDTLSQVHGVFDLVHSHIVLQHIPAVRGMAIIERLLTIVGPGGVALIDFPVKRTMKPLRSLKYFVQHNLFDPRRRHAPAMQMNVYDIFAVTQIMKRLGYIELCLDTEDHGMAVVAKIAGKKGFD